MLTNVLDRNEVTSKSSMQDSPCSCNLHVAVRPLQGGRLSGGMPITLLRKIMRITQAHETVQSVGNRHSHVMPI